MSDEYNRSVDPDDFSGGGARRHRRRSRRPLKTRAARFGRRLGLVSGAVVGVASSLNPEVAFVINSFLTALCGW